MYAIIRVTAIITIEQGEGVYVGAVGVYANSGRDAHSV